MSNFYKTYISLCAKNKKSASGVAEEIGLSRASANGWRNGAMPSEVNLQKIADYFNVSVEYLKGQEPQQDEHSATDSDENLKFALYGADNKDITPAMLDDVRRFAQFVREHKKDDSNDSNKPV